MREKSLENEKAIKEKEREILSLDVQRELQCYGQTIITKCSVTRFLAHVV